MIEIRNATIGFDGKTLFSNISTIIEGGKVVAITGASGKGKTSLLRCIMGFRSLSQGYILIDGDEVNANSAPHLRRQIAYVPQEVALPARDIREMVTMVFQLKANRHIDHSDGAIMEQWNKLGLSSEHLGKQVNEVSGGQRQRMMLATAVMLRKPILIVDEPTSALDAESSYQVAQYLKDYAHTTGAIVVAVSHDKTFVAECDQIIRL